MSRVNREFHTPQPEKTCDSMMFRVSCVLALACALVIGASTPGLSQSGDPKAAERQQTDGKEAPRKGDDIAEAARVISGAAGNPECVWLGRRVVGLLWRDDLDTAFRHLDLYDRFGCPGGHIQSAFRCVIRHGNLIDAKVPESLNSRVHGCWLNPALQPPPPPAAAAAQPGTTAQ
jgi:hypothetical protein